MIFWDQYSTTVIQLSLVKSNGGNVGEKKLCRAIHQSIEATLTLIDNLIDLNLSAHRGRTIRHLLHPIFLT